jgi:4-alpha-glucanotransferase
MKQAPRWQGLRADSQQPVPPDVQHLILDAGGLLELRPGTPAGELPIGVHRVLDEEGDVSGFLAIAPHHAKAPRRGWALSAFLTPVRFAGGEGIGGIVEAERLAAWASTNGGRYLMLGPITAGSVGTPRHFSPYSPISRAFDDVAHLSVEPLAAHYRVTSEELPELAALRELDCRPVADLDSVLELKLAALRRIFDYTVSEPERAEGWAEANEELRLFASFCAAQRHFGPEWRSWPAGLRDREDAALRDFQQERAGEVRFFAWVQLWLDRQLAAIAEHTDLIRDLPVGTPLDSAESWRWRELVAEDWVLGSPPDYFNPDGHRWDLAAFEPNALMASGFAPLRLALRHAFRRATGIRLDHAFGLFRQYWLPARASSTPAQFVSQHTDALLDVIAIEAHRADAFVLTEELGTEPPRGRSKLRERGFTEYATVMTGLPPERRDLAVATTTHDLPTVAGCWTGDDLAALSAAHAPVDRSFDAEARERLRIVGRADDESTVEHLTAAVVDALLAANFLLVVVSIEDLLAERRRINVPGGIEYGFPNFRRRTPTLDTALSATLPRRLTALLVAGNQSA